MSHLFPGPFDPEFGVTGGEDTELFYSLHRNGATMVWCREARVRETVLPERANVAWVLRRSFREGTTYYRVYRRWNIHPDLPVVARYLRFGLWSAGRVARVAVSLAAGVFCPEPRLEALRTVRDLVHNLGIAAQNAGLSYAEYGDR